MTLLRQVVEVDVSAALPTGAGGEPVSVVGDVIADPDALRHDPVVVFATPGGTYRRRYWDLQPPGRGALGRSGAVPGVPRLR